MNLYHYCSNTSFVSILESNSLWASDFSLSNDAMEGKWIREVFSRMCDERETSLYDRPMLMQQIDSVICYAGAAGICMSEDGDLLSQWRAYADNGAGVSIGFSKEYFEKLGDMKRDRNDDFNAALLKVEYNITDQKEIIKDIVDRIFEDVKMGALRKGSLLAPLTDEENKSREKHFKAMIVNFFSLLFFMYRFKNPAFVEEREWRMISFIFPHTKCDPVKHGMDEMGFHALADRIVPFRPIPLEDVAIQCIREIILGPLNLTPINVIEAMLRKHNWQNVTVRRSTASYR